MPALLRTHHSYEILEGFDDLSEWLKAHCSWAHGTAMYIFDDGMSRDGIKVDIGFKTRYFRKPRFLLIIQCESLKTDPDSLVTPFVNDIKLNVPSLILGKRGYEKSES